MKTMTGSFSLCRFNGLRCEPDATTLVRMWRRIPRTRVNSSSRMFSAARRAATISGELKIRARTHSWLSIALCATLYMAPRSVHAQAEACWSSGWSVSHPLVTAAGQPIYVERPVPVPVRGGVAFIGSPTFVWATPTTMWDASSRKMLNERGMIAFAGAVVGPKHVGTPIPLPRLPAPDTIMISPRVFAGADSTVEVFWATGPGTAASAVGGTQLWHAIFDGLRWTNPDRVAQLDMVFWNGSSEAAMNFPDGLGIAAPAHNAGEAGVDVGVVYLHRTVTGWRRSWVETGTLPANYVGLSKDRLNNPVIAFIGSTVDRAHGFRKGVFVTRSSDRGASWDRPLLVRELVSDTTAEQLNVVVGAKGEFHLLWLEFAHGTPRSSVRHLVSNDDGRTWSRSDEFTFPSGTEVFSVVHVPGNGLLSVGLQPLRRLIELATWNARGWSRIARPVPDSAFSLPTLSYLAPSSFVLTWGVLKRTASAASPSGLPAPQSVYTTLPNSCRRAR